MLDQKRLPQGRIDKIRTVKNWVREALGIEESATVMVTELRCAEPGCPPLETVVAILRDGAARRDFKIGRGLDEITYEHVAAAADRVPGGHAHDHAPLQIDHDAEPPPTKR